MSPGSWFDAARRASVPQKVTGYFVCLSLFCGKETPKLVLVYAFHL